MQKYIDSWNSQADQHNQWNDLSEEERNECVKAQRDATPKTAIAEDAAEK